MLQRVVYCSLGFSGTVCPIGAATTRERHEQTRSRRTSPTDRGLSATERKALRVREAQEAIADREEAQTAFHENRERLRKERLVREATEGPMLAPTPELPDDTPIERVLFSTRIQNAL